ncbi:metalloregulator ArsR/SmtB family transcription factor [Microbacterium elymi]|uniref:Metalloregulator ArsR/SmtB family transcription factor n=2 Tax=Microbacterium elymi TaxID=2909587 RepID=A0ABY5NI85_9MICO|nr:metalloregulator ArsR/SmtB family transcription factor [Microbacterium elymi]UUT34863.1 metalloregulator ArsR/SmtB family transcription factor [Microbacterium elymi]
MPPTADARLDAVAAAIASRPRRMLIDRLAEGPATMSALAETIGSSMPATLKHLALLTESGIVARRKQGRTVTFSLVPGSLEPLQDWALSTTLMWSAQLNRFAMLAGSTAQPEEEQQ